MTRDPWWEKIGPAEAAGLLEGSRDNRPLSQRVVDKYAADMSAGRWKKNGSTISICIVDDEILLLNGQHRLSAVVQSGATIEFLMVEEESQDVFSTLDTGYVRTTSQILAMAGFASVNVVQAAARQVLMYQQYPDLTEPWPRSTISQQEVLDWAKAVDPALMHALLSDFQQARGRTGTTNAWYVALDYLVRTTSPHADQWLKFHEGYTTGVALQAGSSMLTLRQFMLNRSRENTRYSTNAWSRQSHLAIAIKSWNDFLSNKPTQVYRFEKRHLPMPKVN